MKNSIDKNRLYEIVCTKCRKVVDENISHTFCPDCGSVLDAKFDYERLIERLNRYDLKNTKISALKYLDFYPMGDFRNVVSLQEGGTPIYEAKKLAKKHGLKSVYLKNEGANPTGVFKDRGTMVEIAKAKESKAKAIILASSGNMAASCAAYAAKADIPCYVLVPEKTPLGKMAQIQNYGAHVLLIKGEYSDCIGLVQKLAKDHNLYLAGDYVYRREGQKSIAYEIIEQLNYNVPDFIVCPVGAGTNIAGIWKGFQEYQRLKMTDKLPKIVGVQASGAAVLADAFRKKLKNYKPWTKTDTICSAVAVADPIDGNLALDAVRKSGGNFVDIDDEDALKAQKYLASNEALFLEPSSALAVAALRVMEKDGIAGKESTVVCVATGNGLKDPMASLEGLKSPKVFEREYGQISEYLGEIIKNRPKAR